MFSHSCNGPNIFMGWEIKCTIQLGFASLNGTLHLSPHENICTIALINIHYLYTDEDQTKINFYVYELLSLDIRSDKDQFLMYGPLSLDGEQINIKFRVCSPGGTSKNFVCGCACRTSKFWLSLTNFVPICHPSIYQFCTKKHPIVLKLGASYHHLFKTHPIIVGFFIFVSTCILERVFSHLEGMCSDCK